MGIFRYIVPFILVCIGTVLLAKGYQDWQVSRALVDSSVVAEGTIVRNAPYLSSKAGKASSLMYFPEVKFSTRDGQPVQFVSTITSRADHYKPGDKVKVYYKADNPRDALIGSFGHLWSVALIFALSGLMVTAFAAWFFWKARVGWEKADRT
ncbi:DUF3592 domain-containing protein [Thiolapillus brandeum]|uniref:DUF3592 domain-containing protein n=1 Tax=Thiolapillus brandeum TaxID=1076588 RepID=A0A7U6JH97_9GAMM|nr:DUF3592 domain-containing protein [Thiolapillus brandeum]BAO44244.1 hypothetical protein TBH_C1319 [Thiolapillus brandeum]